VFDEEGDDISVTTNDELQEALQVGKETDKGFLSLNLSVTGMEGSTRTLIEQTALSRSTTERYIDESTDEEEADDEVLPRGYGEKTEEPDVLQILASRSACAVSEINKALNSASAEIDNMFTQLGTATTKQKKTEEELAAAKEELSQVNSELSTSKQNVTQLAQELQNAKNLLSKSTAQAERDAIRVQNLEKQVAEGAAWENKCKIAEQERAKLDQQLKALRSALKVLTMTESSTPAQPTPVVATVTPATTKKPQPVIAEVISNEIVPASPVIKPASPELPPPYKEPTDTPSFPKNCPAPSPLELKRQQQLQQLRDMGFELTVEQLIEKLEQHSGNMEHVVHSLLSV
jgi:DNA repair ATPase RecN